MRGWIYVFDHPYFAVTDGQGRFRIDAPGGTYRLMVLQPDGRLMREQVLHVEAAGRIDIEFIFTADDLGGSNL